MKHEFTQIQGLVMLGGPGGIGKSTLLRHAESIARNLRCLHMSQELNAFAILTRDKPLADLSPPERDQVRGAHTPHLLHQIDRENKLVLLDCHYTDINEDFHKPIQPAVLMARVDLFLLADAPTSLIVERRSGDSRRPRPLDPKAIDLERESEWAAVQEVARQLAKPVLRLPLDGNLDQSVNKLLDSIDRYLPVPPRW